MTTRPTPAGDRWVAASRTLLDDLSTMLEAAGTPSARRHLVESGIVMLVAAFQSTMRQLLVLGARGIGEAVGGDLGLRVQRVLIGESRLARGNASTENIRVDFGRIGIRVWDLDFGPGVEGWVQRGWLDDINEIRNALAHGAPPPPDLGPTDFEGIADAVTTLDAIVKPLERAVLEVIRSAGSNTASEGE